jgi:hypothetical protein
MASRERLSLAEVLQVNTNTRYAKIRILKTNHVVDVNLSSIDPDGVLDDRAWLLVYMAAHGAFIPISKVARKPTDASIPSITLGDKAGETRFRILNSQRQPVWWVDSLGRTTGTQASTVHTSYGVYTTTIEGPPLSTYLASYLMESLMEGIGIEEIPIRNYFIGTYAGYSAYSGVAQDNIGFGYGALEFLTNGGENVAVGSYAGNSIVGNWGNVLFGHRAGSNMEGMSSFYNVAVGSGAGEFSGDWYNTFVGYRAGRWITLDSNVMVGSYAGMGVSPGSAAEKNVMVGYNSAPGITSGYNNTCVGALAGSGLTSGMGNVFLGYKAGSKQTTQDYELFIHNDDSDVPLIHGEFDNLNVGINTKGYAGGVGVLAIGNAATNPVGGEANTAIFYVSGGEMFVHDSAGNNTPLSPHDPKTGKWIFSSENTKTGRYFRVEMEDLVEEVEKLTGRRLIERYKIEV